MTSVNAVQTPAIPIINTNKTDNKPSSTSPSPLAPAWCITGYSREDNWEAQRLAKYRDLTKAFARGRCDSEPDLVNRRRPAFVPAARQHRRAWTCVERDTQPWVHAVRETRSCPVPPRPTGDPTPR